MNATDDESLVRRYQQGEQDAFDLLFRRYYEYVYKVFVWKGVPSPDAEDFTQDVFAKLAEALSLFAGKSSFKTYLDRTVIHKLIDFYRKRRADTRRWKRLADPIAADSAGESFPEKSVAFGPEDPGRAEEFDAIAHLCMEKLTNLTCRAVVALWLDGFKLRQIAQILALPPGTVNSHSARGRAQLRQCLEEHEIV